MPEKKEYTLTDAPDLSKEQQKQEDLKIPAYMTQIKLEPDQATRLSKEFFLEHDAMDKEWEAAGLIKKFRKLDNQYEGKLDTNEEQQFNLHKHTTKVKVDTYVRYAMKAFLKSDPIFSISPRPDYAKTEGGPAVCEKQQDYLDYKLDEGEIPFKGPIGKVFHSAGNKGLGILKVPHEIKREKRKREEYYKGTPTYILPIPNKKPMVLDQEKYDELLVKQPKTAQLAQPGPNQGLKDFLTSYPDAPERYKGYVKALTEGKELRLVVKYEDTTYNDPLPKYVLAENFRCRLSCEGYEGLKTSKLVTERANFSWWELKKEEAKGKFFDIDNLKKEYNADGTTKLVGGKEVEKKGYEEDNFDVFEGIFYVRLNEEDKEDTKICLWIEEESKKIIGATLYPYYGVDCYYIPFFVSNKWAGFIQPSISEYLTDTNIAENTFLNFTLEAIWMKNMITPITPKNSDLDTQFLEKEWAHGLPLNADPDKVGFLQKYMAPTDVGGLVTMMQVLTRGGDDTSGISSYTTGGESTIDPNAPASKTLALLKESGLNIEEYIDNLLPSFNEVGKVILQLTYQMSKEGRKYKPREKGKDFQEISRAEMVARTNLQSQAMAFAFDKLNEKKEDVALFGLMRQEPLIARNPEAVYMLLKNIIKNWSPKWRNMVDTILPPLADFKREQLKVAVKAMAMYVKGAAEDAKIKGIDPEIDLNQIVALINDATAEMATPPSKEVVKEREKNAKKPVRS